MIYKEPGYFIFEVGTRSIERLIDVHAAEVKENGYEVFTGVRLRALRTLFEKASREADVSDISVGDIAQYSVNEAISAKSPSVGIFTFQALLNIGMLLANSERARELRAAILIFTCYTVLPGMGQRIPLLILPVSEP